MNTNTLHKNDLYQITLTPHQGAPKTITDTVEGIINYAYEKSANYSEALYDVIGFGSLDKEDQEWVQELYPLYYTLKNGQSLINHLGEQFIVQNEELTLEHEWNHIIELLGDDLQSITLKLIDKWK